MDDMTEQSRESRWEAFARHLAGEGSADQSAAMREHLERHPEDRELLAALDAAMAPLAGDLPMDLDIEGALARVKSRADGVTDIEAGRVKRDTGARERTGWRVPAPALAAAALLAIGVTGWVALRDRQPGKSVSSTPGMLATGVGVRDSLELPDGTRVMLGPMSSVSLSSGFGSSRREVVVRGDAWFDVVHDESKPFTVRVNQEIMVDSEMIEFICNENNQFLLYLDRAGLK